MRAWTELRRARRPRPTGWCGPRSCARGSGRRPPSASTCARRRSPTSPTPRSFWQGSPLQVAVERVEQELRRTAEDGDLVVAVTDAADPHPLDVRRTRDAPQGRDRELRGRWALGRHQRRHQRPRPGHPQRRALDGVQRRALRRDRAQLGLLGGARARPGQRRAARRHRPVDDLGPHPPDRAGHRAGDGPADRDRDAGVAPAPRPGRRPGRRGGPRPRPDPARRGRGPARRQAAAAQPAPDRDPRAAGAEPVGALARAAARVPLRRPGGHLLHPQGRGLPPAQRRSTDSSPRAPTG